MYNRTADCRKTAGGKFWRGCENYEIKIRNLKIKIMG